MSSDPAVLTESRSIFPTTMSTVVAPMHQCLDIPEILFLICEIPAITHLWASHRCLAPLIRCMPSDLWVEEDDSKLIFRRAIRETDWERYDIYASKIIQLGEKLQGGLSLLRLRDAHSTVFMSLAAYRPLHSLLPNLRNFRCTGCNSGILPSIQGFIEHKLVNVVVDSADMYDEHGTYYPFNPLDLDILFSSLPRLSPYIRRLYFRIKDSTVTRAIPFDILGNLRHLVELKMYGEIPPAVLNYIASIPSLESFHTPRLSLSHIGSFTANQNLFPNLRYFSFVAIGVPYLSIVEMFNSMQCRFLLLGCIFEGHLMSLAEFGFLVASLHRHSCRTSLNALTLSFKCLTGQPTISLPTIENFRPLPSFPSLKSLEIHTIALDNAWLKELAQALPHLERLFVPAHIAEKPKVTLEGITPLIKLCPELSDLRITLIAHPIPLATLDGIFNNSIKTIILDHSTITQSKKVFRSLIRMFPHLTNVKVYEARNLYTAEENMTYKMRWYRINRLLRETC
ncbi:hypothetical protein BDZ94DRAFT_1020645 [Collybia nuda]|uniref:F-box domain-containing protein n=1 Tax=Collybia nuda TaxID=64659 RepID=A0A9P5Y133_9AGAR|nr:hypothetical protein BDZ94DRAFT_1020645 [Collybia nuda]